MTAVAIETAISEHRAQIGDLQRRLPDLDAQITEVRELLSGAEARLAQQSGEVARTQLATGRAFTFGGPDLPRVTWSDGNGTRRVTGPSPIDSPTGRAEHARRVYAALEGEITPIRGALTSLEQERADVAKGVGLLGGEVDHLDRQLQQIRAAETEHATLIGPVGWRERLNQILRRTGVGG